MCIVPIVKETMVLKYNDLLLKIENSPEEKQKSVVHIHRWKCSNRVRVGKVVEYEIKLE
jgi:hypothetical protein